MKFVFCHRRPDRTLKFRGRYFPVCARCTGIYLGAIFIIMSYYYDVLIYDIFIHGSFLTQDKYLFYIPTILTVPVILAIPTIIDFTTQLLKWRESRNWIRVITGFCCGIGYGFALIYW